MARPSATAPALRCNSSFAHVSRPLRLATLCAALATALPVSAADVVRPQSGPSQAYAIPAGGVGQVLVQFAASAGVQIAFAPALLAGLQSPGLAGRYTTHEGFARILEGSGYRAVARSDHQYALEPAPRPPRDGEAATLAPVTVMGQASPTAQSEGTGSYTNDAITLGKGAQSLKDIPQSVSVLTRAQLDDQNLNSLNDALRNVTGITVDTLSTGSNMATFMSRGYALDSILVDGLSTPAGTGNFSTGFDLAIYDRVEVLRGPSGLYQGTGEPGGSVNLVRKRPLEGFAFGAQGSVGSWNYYRAVADLSTPLDAAGKIRGRFIAAYEDRDSFVDRVESRRPTLYGIVEADLGSRTTLAAGITHQRFKSSPAFGLPAFADGRLLDVKRSTNLSADWNKMEEETTEYFSDLTHRLDNGGKINASVFHRTTEAPTRLFTWPNSAVSPINGNTNLVGWSYYNKWKTTGADTNINLPINAFGQTHSVLLGTDYSYTQKDFSYGGGSLFPTNAYKPITNPTQPDFDRVNGSEGRVSQLGIYSRANVEVTDWLKVIAGARLSWWKNDSRNNNVYFNDFSERVDRISARTTPYAGIVVDLTPEVAAYASYTSIFQPQTTSDIRGNTLKPRTGAQYETGLKGEFLDGRLNAHAALFQITDRNRAMTDPDNPLYSIAAGKVRSQGFETEISGSPLEGWQLVAGYAYTHTKFLEAATTSQGKPFSTITPRHSVNLWTRYAFSTPALQGFSVGGGVRVNSGFYTQSGAVRWEQGATALFSAQAGYRYDKHLEGTVTIDNLFDKKYYERLGGASRQNYYGQPRSVMLTMRYQY